MVNLKQQIQKINEKAKGYAFACWFGVCDAASTDPFTTEGGFVGKVQEVVQTAVYASGLVAVIVLVYGAFVFITAGGGDQKIEQGNKIITSSIVGLIIVFLADVIIKFVINKVL